LTSKLKVQDLVDDLDLDHVPQDDFSAGLTYPEDVHNDDMGLPLRAEYIDIPNDWKKCGLSRISVNPTIDRLKTSMSIWSGDKYTTIEKQIKAVRKKKGLPIDEPINWTDRDWWCFSSNYSTDIIIARYNYNTDTTKVHKWIKSEKTKNYCVVFYVDSPEILLSVKTPIEMKDLPKMIQRYFDTAAPTTWDLVK
jgi:hypothetical protein